MLLDGMQLGRYRIVSFIRRGGMSEIYLAEDTRMSRQVAVKIMQNGMTLYPDENTMQEAPRLFQREMGIISSLYHPHILQLYDFGEETVSGTPFTYMVMPFHPQGSLVDWLRQRGKDEPLAAEDVVALMLQAADALQYAHDRQIIHLDVKPSNFLVHMRKERPNQPDLFLADFGIAKVTSTSKGSSTMRGTLEYMAPEQWDGHPVAASDQYSLAIMAYELLTGSVPFRGNMSQIMFKHFQEVAQPPSALNPRIPPAFDAVILRALAKNPADRFASVSEFAHTLQQALQASKEIRATLAINDNEAMSGTKRTLTLPGGRKITVTVPAGSRDGQLMRLNDQGEPSYGTDAAGILLLTISVKQKEEAAPSTDLEHDKKTERGSNPLAPIAPTVQSQAPVAVEPTIPPAFSDQRNDVASAFGVAPALASSESIAPPPPPPPSSPTIRRRPAKNLLLIVLACIVIIAGIASFGVYQNNVNQANAEATASANSTATATVVAAIAGATATVVAANPYPSYFPGSGTLEFYDPLSQAGRWSEVSDASFGGSCQFNAGAYYVSETTKGNLYNCDNSSAYGNLAFQVQMTILQGDCGGIVFRDNSSSTQAQFYDFRVCQDQTYSLDLFKGNTNSTVLRSGSSNQINHGFNLKNTVAAAVSGSLISLFVNGQKIDGINDSTYSSGQIGLIASDANSATRVAYTDARVWML